MDEFWKAARRRRRIGRRHRRARANALIPAVRLLCEKYGIDITCNDHGYQFRKGEYVVLWSPSTNKVNIQYTISGHGQTVPFDAGSTDKPKILEALTRLIEVTA